MKNSHLSLGGRVQFLTPTDISCVLEFCIYKLGKIVIDHKNLTELF